MPQPSEEELQKVVDSIARANKQGLFPSDAEASSMFKQMGASASPQGRGLTPPEGVQWEQATPEESAGPEGGDDMGGMQDILQELRDLRQEISGLPERIAEALGVT